MPYIEREAGTVVGLLRWPQFDSQEWLAEDHSEVVAFRDRPGPPYEPSAGELLDAVGDAIKLADTAKLDALIAKRSG